MRHFLYVILMLAGLLAACTGNAESQPTASGQVNGQPSPLPPDMATSLALTFPAPTPPSNRQRIYATGQPTLPPPGVLIPPAEQDLNIALVFDSILLQRTGGSEGVPLDIEIRNDGTVTRDGQASTVSVEVVNQIDGLLDQMDFFGMGGVFSAPGTSDQVYTYRITVNRQGSSRTVTAQEGYMPTEIIQLVSVLSQAG